MQVKIGDKLYDSHDEPIMLILEESDKKNISNMDDQDKYCSFPEGITPNKARIFMGLEPLKKEELSNEKPKNKHPLNLRPCEVKLPHDRNGFSANAHFHSWCNKGKIIEPSPLVGGSSGGTIYYTVGIIEYEDGTIDEVIPQNIKFTDRGW